MVLFLFVVMMLDVKVEQVRAGFTRWYRLQDIERAPAVSGA